MSPFRSLRWRALATTLVLGVALAACSGGPDPAATVGGQEISQAQLGFDTQLYTFLTGLSGAPCGTPVGDESNGSACARFTLGNDIREEIVKQYAAAHDLSVKRSDIDAAIGQVTQGVGGGAVLAKKLKDQGLQRQDLVTLARRLLLFNAVLGTALVASGASALNQWMERDTDALMRRTRNRPLPAGRRTARPRRR